MSLFLVSATMFTAHEISSHFVLYSTPNGAFEMRSVAVTVYLFRLCVSIFLINCLPMKSAFNHDF